MSRGQGMPQKSRGPPLGKPQLSTREFVRPLLVTGDEASSVTESEYSESQEMYRLDMVRWQQYR